MSRPKFKRQWSVPWRPFYVPSKKFVGAGIKDSAGKCYVVAPGGNLVKVVTS